MSARDASLGKDPHPKGKEGKNNTFSCERQGGQYRTWKKKKASAGEERVSQTITFTEQTMKWGGWKGGSIYYP